MKARLERLSWETAELAQLYKFFGESQLHTSVYPEWDALDVLRHLVWWHESFASIVQAAHEGAEGDVPRGSLAEVNARSVGSMVEVGPRSLIRRLRAAQRLIEDHRDLPGDESLGYRRGSRRYSFISAIEISIAEMSEHRRDVLRAVLAADRATVVARSRLEATACIFCDIVNGTAPASIVWEDDLLLAFMDAAPVTRGHVLVVPKAHAVGLDGIPPETAARMIVAGQRLAAALKSSGLRCEGVNLFFADGEAAFQEVFHSHLHVFPRYPGDGFTIDARWETQPRGELDKAARVLRDALGR